MASEKELRLVADVVAGRNGAWDAFIAEYRTFVFAILTRHLGFSPDDADEVFQRFLIHVWEAEHRRLRCWSGQGTFRAYLGTMVRNLGRDYRREVSRSAESGEVDVPVESPHADERVEWIRSALFALSARDRDLIRRRYDLEETYKEMAEALGMTVSHVGVALHRAEKRLKKLLSGGL